MPAVGLADDDPRQHATGITTALLPQVTYHEVRYPSPVLDPSLTPGALTSGSIDSNGRFDGRLACPRGRDDRGRVRQLREGRAMGHLRDLDRRSALRLVPGP